LDLEDARNNPYSELAPLLDKIEEQKLTIQEEAAARESMRREFSANVSHELKTPLTSISGFAELLAEGIVSGDKVPEFAKDIYKESQRLISLVDDIIKLSKLDENAVDPKREGIDLKELAMDVAENLRPNGESRAISIETRGESAKITGAYNLLYEMVYNLCENAVKYNIPGGKVIMETSTDPEHAIISVADTGIGIAPENQKRVFERFYRVDKSHSKEIGGTGLGLSIVKHGALYHNAKIELESEEGHGTTVRLIFEKSDSL
jgi:two-component system phosphate regulon sensor histidine kinase PhoR